jgi:alpha-tubulin suppressor-like RCC1 family protein
MAEFGFKDSSGVDLGNKYVTKEYLMDVYPELLPNMIAPMLWVWGDNEYGQLGTGNTSSRSAPVNTSGGGINWKQVSCGYAHSAAIKTDGTLWTWGYNLYGQLGNGNTSNYSSPITTSGGGTNWTQVSCGYAHSAAIKTDGTLWTWGFNTPGQLGTNNTSNYSSPVTTSGGGTNWKQVACGQYHIAAIKTDGTLWTCGYNLYGQLGDGTTTNRSSPVTTSGGGTNWKQVASGLNTQIAIKTDGTLWAWGRNENGQLGTNNTSNYSSPVTTSGGGTNWKQVAIHRSNHMVAIKTDGTLWAWGANSVGQLGNSNTSNYSSPVTTIAGGTNWKYAVTGAAHTAAIKTDGTLWACGWNNKGQLGDGTTTNRSSPVNIIAQSTVGTTWKSVTCGQYYSFGLTETGDW